MPRHAAIMFCLWELWILRRDNIASNSKKDRAIKCVYGPCRINQIPKIRYYISQYIPDGLALLLFAVIDFICLSAWLLKYGGFLSFKNKFDQVQALCCLRQVAS